MRDQFLAVLEILNRFEGFEGYRRTRKVFRAIQDFKTVIRRARAVKYRHIKISENIGCS